MAKKTTTNKRSTKAEAKVPAKKISSAAATKQPSKSAKAPSKAKNAKATKPKASTRANTATPKNVRVKSSSDLMGTVRRQLAYNLHDRFNVGFSKQTRAKIVAYGPWLATASVVIISPQILNLAKNGNLISVSGFFNEIFFNQESWVILVILLLNVLILVDGLTDLFAKSSRGWNRVYLPALITGFYALWQLLANLSQPAAPLLATLGAWFVVFTILDVRDYYN